jgi:uncharacterized protein GlcG (DUF336 family)
LNRISLDQANIIIAGAFEKGAELGLKPLTIAVLDPGGHLIAFARSDASSRPARCGRGHWGYLRQ